MNFFKSLVIFGWIAGLSGCSSLSLHEEPVSGDVTVVKTEKGYVRGVFRNGTLEFRGIPYAAAPVDKLRWAMPEPRESWKGILDASKFGSACPQVARYHLTEGSTDEDCLFVNVSVPEKAVGKSQKLPVFVWIHGGAFVGGGSNLYRLDALAREGNIIMVSMNYRLGALGFLAHPAFERKVFGLEDQRAAMRWVKANIAAFGGDPEQITIGGESAGAGSTCAHVSSPELVKGLFSKAVIQSAGCTWPLPTYDEASVTGTHIAGHPLIGCNDPKINVLECMRKTPLKDILAAQTEISTKELLGFAITNQNETLPTSTAIAFKSGKITRVPILMGGTSDELRLYVGYDVQAGKVVTPETYPLAVEKLYGKNKDKILKEYALKSGDVPAEKLGSMMSDYIPTPGINNCMYQRAAKLASKVTSVYQFEFADENAPGLGVGIALPDPGFKIGACHSSELNYLFPKLDNTSKINAPDLAPASQKLADQMVAYWASFVKTGVPVAKGSPAWPKYKNPKSTLRLEPGIIRTYDASKAHHCDFWGKLYPQELR